jgi:hypothetical protein
MVYIKVATLINKSTQESYYEKESAPDEPGRVGFTYW